jgi:hypothetical protein
VSAYCLTPYEQFFIYIMARTSARLGLIWFNGFRGEDLNVKVYDVRWTPSDGKGELKIQLGMLV